MASANFQQTKNALVCALAFLLGMIAVAFTASTATAAPPKFGVSEIDSSLVRLNSDVLAQADLRLPVVYDLYIAEPSKLQYVLEFRYIETSTQAGSDWMVYSTADAEEDLDELKMWIAFHLIAEYRIVERWTEPQWEFLDTYSDLSDAEADAEFFENFGLLTEIDARVLGLTKLDPVTQWSVGK